MRCCNVREFYGAKRNVCMYINHVPQLLHTHTETHYTHTFAHSLTTPSHENTGPISQRAHFFCTTSNCMPGGYIDSYTGSSPLLRSSLARPSSERLSRLLIVSGVQHTHWTRDRELLSMMYTHAHNAPRLKLRRRWVGLVVLVMVWKVPRR